MVVAVEGDIADKQISTINRVARHLGERPVYPTDVSYDFGLDGTPVKGYQFDGPGGRRSVRYSPEIRRDRFLRDRVPAHEAVHVQQGELKEALAGIYLVTFAKRNGTEVVYAHAVGRDLLEGTAELLLDKVGEGRTGAYPREFRMAQELDKVYPVEQFYRDVMEEGAVAVLSKPRVRRVVADFYLNRNESVLRN